MRVWPLIVVWLLAGCAAGGFSVRFSEVTWRGSRARVDFPEPSPAKRVGGVAGWQLQQTTADRASWFWGDAITGWPPQEVLLVLVLEDREPQPAGHVSWAQAWAKPGLVGRSALEQAADLRWVGEAERVIDDTSQTDVAPARVASRDAWGGSAAGGFSALGYVVCRCSGERPVILCAFVGAVEQGEDAADEPAVETALRVSEDPRVAARLTWLKELLGLATFRSR